MTYNEFKVIVALPVDFVSISELDRICDTPFKYKEQFVYSENDKLTPMTARYAEMLEGKNVRIMFKSNTIPNIPIMTENGILHYDKKVNIENGWGNIEIDDIIDWILHI